MAASTSPVEPGVADAYKEINDDCIDLFLFGSKVDWSNCSKDLMEAQEHIQGNSPVHLILVIVVVGRYWGLKIAQSLVI